MRRAWMIAVISCLVVWVDFGSAASRRSLQFKVGVYDPQGASETSRNRPSRKPVTWSGDMIDLSRPSPPPPPVAKPPPANASPSPFIPTDPSPGGQGNLLARGSMCSARRIKEDKTLAGNFVGNNYYEPCDHRVSGAEECCAMCQNNAACTGFVYERADCSGRAGPTDVGVCLLIRDSVISWPAPESQMGSLNPFAQ